MNKIIESISSLFSEENKLDILNLRYLPRWAVLFIDTFILLVALLVTYLFLSDLNITPLNTITVWQQMCMVLGVNFIFLLVFKTYAGLIRHSSYMDALKILLACLCTFITLIVFNITYNQIIDSEVFRRSGLLAYALISFVGLFLFRLVVKQLYESFKGAQLNEKIIKAVIVGIDDSAISIAAALDMEHPQRFVVQGFVSKKQNKSLRILDKPVLHLDKGVHNAVKKLNATAIIFAGNS